jgi:hypothetical protein
VGVVDHVFPVDLERAVGAFRAELEGGSFDARRLALE